MTVIDVNSRLWGASDIALGVGSYYYTLDGVSHSVPRLNATHISFQSHPSVTLEDFYNTVTHAFVFPETYGAVGDGITDDTVALQTCINLPGPKTIRLSRTYLTGELILASDTAIVGPGGLALKASTSSQHVLVGYAKQNVFIVNIYIYGNKALQSYAYSSGIYLDGCTNSLVSNNIITDCKYAGIYISSGYALSGNITVRENNIDSCAYGIRATGQQLTIIYNYCLACTVIGIWVLGAQVGCVYLGNKINGANITQYGFYIDVGVGNCGIFANSFGYCVINGFSMYLTGSGLTIDGNQAIYNGQLGYLFLGSAGFLDNLAITNNVAAFNAGTGFSIQEVYSSMISGNRAYANNTANAATTANMYFVNSAPAYNTLIGNVTKLSAGHCQYGIWLASDYNQITYNDFSYGGSVINVYGAPAANAFSHNKGFATASANAATITTGTTSIVISHGLDITPSAHNIVITPSANSTNDIGSYYVDTITASQFTVHTHADPGAAGFSFTWKISNW